MRIISGKFKGKKITLPLDKSTRPLKDMVKESIFNLIKHSTKFGINLETSNILDLFSGIGSFGIECLSRGVKNVTFFENYPKVLPILKNNLAKLSDTSNYEIIEEEINNETKFYQLNKKFDLIFLDPPFKNNNLEKLLINIYEQNILNNNAIFIIHRHKKDNDKFPKFLQILDIKKYGLSKIIFLNLNQ